jgi:hypothetical protein
MQSRFYLDEMQATIDFYKDVARQGPHVQMVRWDSQNDGVILRDRYQK